MKLMLCVLVTLLPSLAYSIGVAGDAHWPKGVVLEVKLSLSAVVDTNGQIKVSGDLLIKNQSDASLIIQNPDNRLVLAFLIIDPLGNPVAPVGRGKSDPPFQTHPLPARATYTHHFDKFDFVTGSARFAYDLSPGKTYRVVVVYRPAGPRGPGFTSQEAILEIPK